MRLQPYACLAVWKALSAQAKAPPTNCTCNQVHPNRLPPTCDWGQIEHNYPHGVSRLLPNCLPLHQRLLQELLHVLRQAVGGRRGSSGRGGLYTQQYAQGACQVHALRICIRVEQRRGRRRLFVCTRTHLDVSKEEGSCSREGSGHTRGAVSGAGTSSGRQALLFSGAVRLLPPSCWL